MIATRTCGVTLLVGLAALISCSGLALAGCGGGHEAASTGAQGQPCYPNDTCDTALLCKQGKCVEGSSGGAGGAGGSGATSATSGSGGRGGNTHATATSSTSGAGGAGGSGGAPPGNHARSSCCFGTDVMSITQGQTVILSAVLTDPDGINDIIGGTLTDSGGATYGAFATSAQEGAYELSVSWDLFNQVNSIEFAQGDTGQRVLTAKFFDQEGNSAEQSTTITFTCNGNASCGGTCTNTTDSASHCGSCGHACSGGNGCYEGKCGKLGGCHTSPTTCAAVCAAAGKVCKNLCAGSGGVQYDNTQTCSSTANWHPMACTDTREANASMKCCCF